jgi:hypothetical protein
VEYLITRVHSSTFQTPLPFFSKIHRFRRVAAVRLRHYPKNAICIGGGSNCFPLERPQIKNLSETNDLNENLSGGPAPKTSLTRETLQI